MPLSLRNGVINSFGNTTARSFEWSRLDGLLLLLMNTKILDMALTTNIPCVLLVNTARILRILHPLLLRQVSLRRWLASLVPSYLW